jgi:hypothetical protein
MLWEIVVACVLVAVTVAVHAGGLSLLLQSLMKSRATPPTQTWSIVWLLIKVTWLLMLIHAAEITIWALFYWWGGSLPDAESAFCFSGVSYTTVGYGDVVLAKPWRVLGPLEGLTGILMCGLSASLFFALVSRLYVSRSEAKRK